MIPGREIRPTGRWPGVADLERDAKWTRGQIPHGNAPETTIRKRPASQPRRAAEPASAKPATLTLAEAKRQLAEALAR